MSAILLAGLRGSGKSTVAPALAEALGRAWVDLDDLTRASLGCATVRQAWESRGETAFRRAELGALRHALRDSPGQIVALGGGTPMIEGFAGVLPEGARLVYLHAPPAVLRSRLAEGDPDRPPLLGRSALDEVQEVYDARDPVYRGLAHAVVDAAGGRADTLRAVVAACSD